METMGDVTWLRVVCEAADFSDLGGLRLEVRNPLYVITLGLNDKDPSKPSRVEEELRSLVSVTFRRGSVEGYGTFYFNDEDEGEEYYAMDIPVLSFVNAQVMATKAGERAVDVRVPVDIQVARDAEAVLDDMMEYEKRPRP
jgi:hypothetical protein